MNTGLTTCLTSWQHGEPCAALTEMQERVQALARLAACNIGNQAFTRCARVRVEIAADCVRTCTQLRVIAP